MVVDTSVSFILKEFSAVCFPSVTVIICCCCCWFFKVWHFRSLLMVHQNDLTHGRCFVEWCLGCICLSLFTHFTLLFYSMCLAAVKQHLQWGELSWSNLNESIKWCHVLSAWESSCAVLLHSFIRLRCPPNDSLFMDKTTKIFIEVFTSWSRCGVENVSFFLTSSFFPPLFPLGCQRSAVKHFQKLQDSFEASLLDLRVIHFPDPPGPGREYLASAKLLPICSGTLFHMFPELRCAKVTYCAKLSSKSQSAT